MTQTELSTTTLPGSELSRAECYLEHFSEPEGTLHRVSIEALPFRIGRGAAAHLVVRLHQVSKEHAEIYCLGEQFYIRDLNSTNGTFVNGQRIREAFLVNGDIVHVAHQEFRFVQGDAETPHNAIDPVTQPANTGLPSSLIKGQESLRDLLRQHCVRVAFQPIVQLDTGRTIGFEALGRGTHSDLSINPSHLFRLAERCKLEVELSGLFREAAIQEARTLPENTLLFLNSHPSELEAGALLPSLDAICPQLPRHHRIVIEVHEDTTADLATISRLRSELKARDIQLAYDDFGAGQSRLAELAAAPPDYVKLDLRLVRGIDRDDSRQNLVQAINRLIHEFGIQVVAEGIETREEAAVCLRLGCQYGQGYLFGMPQTAATFEQTRKKLSDTQLFDLSELRQRLGSQSS